MENNNPYWESPMVSLYQGDAATVLRQLPAESVDLCCTSPPFYGLRNYRVEGQIGLEPTPDLWLEHILAVFREVRRVLRPWGTCWIEIGDSYASGKGTCFNPGGGEDSLEAHGKLKDTGTYPLDRGNKSSLSSQGLKPLDLVGIPFRLALALEQDGWWLRSVIIWDKPAPMPESVNGWRWQKCRAKVKGFSQKSGGLVSGKSGFPSMDTIPLAQWADCPGCPKCAPNDGLVLRKGSWRPTEAHSYILMLAKGVPYFTNGFAVQEKGSGDSHGGGQATGKRYGDTIWGIGSQSGLKQAQPAGSSGRNARTVWRIGPESSSLPHFATFPTGLPEKCILVGTSEWGNCPRCAMPWAPVIKLESAPIEVFTQRHAPTDGFVHSGSAVNGKMMGHGQKLQAWRDEHPSIILAWRPTCQCGLSERVAPVVLDPFVGSGTTCVAAQQLGRRSIGIDLSAKYLDMAIKRLDGVPLPLGVGLP